MDHAQKAADILVNYFEQAGVDMSGDGRAEIEATVEMIVTAAVVDTKNQLPPDLTI